MKTTDLALAEWACGEIAIDLGRGKKIFTRDQIQHLCEYLRTSSFGPMDFYLVFEDKLGQQFDVQLKTFANLDSFKEVQEALRRGGKLKEFGPRMMVQFDSLREIEKWAEGELESRISTYVPPVDSWMKPL